VQRAGLPFWVPLLLTAFLWAGASAAELQADLAAGTCPLPTEAIAWEVGRARRRSIVAQRGEAAGAMQAGEGVCGSISTVAVPLPFDCSGCCACPSALCFGLCAFLLRRVRRRRLPWKSD